MRAPILLLGGIVALAGCTPTLPSSCQTQSWFFADVDGDGFGDEAAATAACKAPEGSVEVGGDCDDSDAEVHPDADDDCDGIDNDCSGSIDEEYDLDGDGDSACGQDCDDEDFRVGGHLEELCDRIDNDCDGEIDENFDDDGDGWPTCRGDCDDDDPLRFPGQPEACDGIDNDCDPDTVDADDLDDDGVSLCEGDCNDNNGAAYPGAQEICDGVDNDCDGAIDEEFECLGCVESGAYTFCGAYVSYDAAAAACAEAGLALAVFETSEENFSVSSTFYDNYGQAAWIGYDDTVNEGVWAWITGNPSTFTSWWSGEPNNSGEEDCAGTNFGDIGYWNDYDCNTALPFICE